MRCVIAMLIIVGLVAPASAALRGTIEFSSVDATSRWISNYRAKPDPARLPAAVRALSQLGAFKDPDGAGVYVGFIAGVISANPDKAEELIARMLPIAPADQWVIVRAIAYSGHHDWKGLLRKFAERMPLRKAMIDKYLDGKLQTLDEIPLEKKNPTLLDKARGLFQGDKDGKVTALIPDPAPVKEGTGAGTGSAAEGVAADADGNVYGAEVDARKLMRYVKK